MNNKEYKNNLRKCMEAFREECGGLLMITEEYAIKYAFRRGYHTGRMHVSNNKQVSKNRSTNNQNGGNVITAASPFVEKSSGMTRTIKFRGKRLDNGEWAHGDLLKPHTGTRIVNYDESEPQPSVRRTDFHYHDVDPATVGQFTGLLDKSGKEIYEGDVLGCLEDEDFLPEIVIFKDGCFMAEDSYTTIAMNTIDTEYRTIIGNIHDNKLLNEK